MKLDDLSPTKAQTDQAAVAQHDFEELIDRLIRDGFDYRSILTGAAIAITNSIAVSAGQHLVPTWFAQNAALTMHLAKDKPQ